MTRTTQDLPVLKDPAQVISDVKRALELRHIICHEGQEMHFVTELRSQTTFLLLLYVCPRMPSMLSTRFLNAAGPTSREDL